MAGAPTPGPSKDCTIDLPAQYNDLSAALRMGFTSANHPPRPPKDQPSLQAERSQRKQHRNKGVYTVDTQFQAIFAYNSITDPEIRGGPVCRTTPRRVAPGSVPEVARTR